MAKTARLMTLVALLSGRRSHSIRELVDRFDTTERTIYRDLAELEEIGIPVDRDEFGYRVSSEARFAPLALDAGEREVLRLALENPVIRKSKPLARRLDLLVSKLERLTIGETAGHLVLAATDRSGPIQPGILELLERATAAGSSLEMDYASLHSGKRTKRGIDPWAIFHRSEAWYLVGWCHKHDELRLFRLDRIAGLRETGDQFSRPKNFSVETFLADAWSLHHGEPRHEVVIRFDASLVPLIANARHHEGEQIERLPDGTLEYRVKLADLDEIARWIAGFGGRAAALAPGELVDRVRQMAESVVKVHPRAPAEQISIAAKQVRAPRSRKGNGRRKSARPSAKPS